MQRKFVTVIGFFFIFFSALAQQHEDKDALQREREKLKKEIAETEKALE